MDSHRIGKIAPLFFISVICLFGCNVFASFMLGTNIIKEEGTVGFASSEILEGSSRSGDVDYKVYGPQTYTGALEAVSSDHHVYAYQVFNDAISDLSIESFIVSLTPGAVVSSIYYVLGDGKEPWDTSPGGSESAAYFFHLNPIGAGEKSSILWYSSVEDSTPGSATVNGASGYVGVDDIPVPIPEPVSFVLFGGGLLMLRFKRRSLKRS